MTYRFPEGVSFDGQRDDGSFVVRVAMPADEDGFFGRQCPSCHQVFRVSDADYDSLPDDADLWCVYCGHVDEHSEFLTDQQEVRAMRAAEDYAEQMIGGILDDSFGRIARRSKGLISYRSKPFYPDPLPQLDEERLIRERACAACGVRYAIFGEHRFCPVCGPLSPLAVAEDALASEVTRLNALDELPSGTLSVLREEGALDRTYVDTIENLVGIVEVLAQAAFRSVVKESDDLLRGRGNLFQRLQDTADIFLDHCEVDLRSAVGESDWSYLVRAWAARHVFTHCDGFVDAKYLSDVPNSPLREGQRLRITEAEVMATIGKVQSLCRVITSSVSRLT